MSGTITGSVLRLRAALADRYAIEREIGQGGMAIVYLARDVHLDRPVAIKVLRPELAAVLGPGRFQREIHITASLHHPNILPLLDSGAADGFLYFAMPYVEGETLRDLLEREGPLGADRAVAVACEVADALEYAHGHGIVHRDVKPENILLSSGKAVVADFGVARAVAVAGGENISSAGLAIGTPAYMSPEQAAGSADVGHRSDVYSLGCVLFEMLAGEPPFTGPSPQAVLARHVAERTPSLAVLRPSLPAALVRTVESALAKSPADRPASAAAMAQQLRAALSDRTAAGAAGRTGRQRWWPAVLAAAVALPVIAWLVAHRPRPLDPSRVVVFPLHVPAESKATLGADIATYIGNVLEGSDPLRWEEATDYVGTPAAAPETGEESARAALAKRRHARWFVDGTVIAQRDSLTVVLRLHDATGQVAIRRAGKSAAVPASEMRLAALAMGDLLPALLDPGRRVDVTPLANRAPPAIAHFVLGERAYRRADFAAALEHFSRAVEEDSQFALAAIKGAQAAGWIERDDRLGPLLAVAGRHRTQLSARYDAYTGGLLAYYSGDADSAAARFQRALTAAPDWAEAWASLGEVYTHLVPSAPRADTLARYAFGRAFAADSVFVPAFFHLTQLAALDGDITAATQFASRLRRGARDSSLIRSADLLLGCATHSVDARDWQHAVARNLAEAFDALAAASSAPALGRCAEAGLRTVIALDSGNYRGQAFLLLHLLMLREGRVREVRALLSDSAGIQLGGPYYMAFEAPVEPSWAPDANRFLAARAADLASASPTLTWLVAVWRSASDSAAAARHAALALRAKTDASPTPDNERLSRIADAHATLAAGDSADALRRLAALRPIGGRAAMAFSLQASFGYERLTLARLLLARGDARGALRTADQLDARAPVVYILYARPSLVLRVAAARALRDRGLEGYYERRLAALTPPD